MSLRSDDFDRAVKRIDGLINASASQRKAYNRVALVLPHLLSANGLSQTVAFFEEKANKPERNKAEPREDAQASSMILDEIAGILGVGRAKLLEFARDADTTRATFDLWRLQSAWAYQRRYAEALLGATAGEE